MSAVRSSAYALTAAEMPATCALASLLHGIVFARREAAVSVAGCVVDVTLRPQPVGRRAGSRTRWVFAF